jgi:hypothetical protein
VEDRISWTGVSWNRAARPVDAFERGAPLDRALADRIRAEAGLDPAALPATGPAVVDALAAVDEALRMHPARIPRLHSAQSLMIIALIATGADLGHYHQTAREGLEAINIGPHPSAMAGLLRAAGATLGGIDVGVVRDRVAPLLACDPGLLWERDPERVRARVGEMQKRWKSALKLFDSTLDRIELRLPQSVGDRLVVPRAPRSMARDLARRLHERYRRPVEVAGVHWGGWSLRSEGELTEINDNRARALDDAGPYGPGRPAPLWVVSAEGLHNVRPLKRSHAKASLDGVDVVWRGGRRYMERLPEAKELLAELRMTQWQGIERPQLVVRDAR